MRSRCSSMITWTWTQSERFAVHCQLAAWETHDDHVGDPSSGGMQTGAAPGATALYSQYSFMKARKAGTCPGGIVLSNILNRFLGPVW